MLPRSRAPARSSSRGSIANTDGGYPRVAGGSPADRPTSRCAIAKRVSESIKQQDVAALVAERLGDARRGEGGAQANERRSVGRCDDDDRARQAFGSEVVLDELAHLSATFTDEREHGDRGLGAARDHRQQRRLADAGTGEDAHALAAAARDERVERAHAERQRLVDRAAA